MTRAAYRIYLHVEVPALPVEDLSRATPGESSGVVRQRVERARSRQIDRQGMANARLAGGEVEARARLDAQARHLLRGAASSLMLSARAHHRILKVARTIADMDPSPEVRSKHVEEALCYRGLRRKPA